MRPNIKRKTFFLVMTVIVLFVFILPSWVFSSPKKPSIFFLHHSVGGSLIRNGSVRQILAESGFELWDHGRNHSQNGLQNEKGEPYGCYWIPEDNTYPDGLANLFRLNPKGENALSRMLRKHDVILFKSCFPASHIQEDHIATDLLKPKRRSLYNYRRHYLSIRDTVDKHPDKIFIVVTQPPLHPNVTDRNEAQRARAFVEWVKSSDYLGGRKNLFVFDYFNLLADPKTNMLRREFQINPKGKNSHPNVVAQMLCGVRFADFIINIYKFKRNANLPKVTLDNPKVPGDLIRVCKPVLSLSGRVISRENIKRIFWSDLKGRGNDLLPGKSWILREITLSPGVTKVFVTAINEQGLRSSSVVGLQYYSGKAKKAIIFDESLRCGILSGMSYSEENPYVGKKHLIIRGNGQHKRVTIKGLALDISDFDPQTSHLEIQYDQGSDKTKPKLFISGIGSLSMDVDGKSGYEKIVIPLRRYTYVNNILERLIIRGNWAKTSKIYLDSIKLVSAGIEH